MRQILNHLLPCFTLFFSFIALCLREKIFSRFYKDMRCWIKICIFYWDVTYTQKMHRFKGLSLMPFVYCIHPYDNEPIEDTELFHYLRKSRHVPILHQLTLPHRRPFSHFYCPETVFLFLYSSIIRKYYLFLCRFLTK